MILKPSISIALDQILECRYLANISRSHDNRWIVLNIDKSPWDRSGNRVPLVPPFKFGVYTHTDFGWSQAFPELLTEKLYHYAQPMQNGEWLLVQARAIGSEDRNGHVFDRHGRLIRSIFLDDGIEDVQTTESGEIWVSYFDEGIFGGGRYSQNGLVCFGSDGTPRLAFNSEITDRFGVPDICDCYALNVCENGDTWTSYYTDFPIVKFRGAIFENAWTGFPRKAIRAIAARNSQLLVVPAYQKKSALYFYDMQKQTVQDVTAVDESGTPFEFRRAIGRNATLGFICESESKRIVLRQYDVQSLFNYQFNPPSSAP